MDRPDDITLPPDTPWLADADVQAVCRAISAQGAEIYFVGGCVRDALLGIDGAVAFAVLSYLSRMLETAAPQHHHSRQHQHMRLQQGQRETLMVKDRRLTDLTRI